MSLEDYKENPSKYKFRLTCRAYSFQEILQRWADQDKKRVAAKAVEDYKASEAFQDEIIEASKRVFDFGFQSCRDLVKMLFSNFDISL